MRILLQVVDIIFLVYMVMLFIRIMASWFPEFANSTFMRFVSFYTDPYLNLFRSFIPPLGMMDFSPIVAFFALQILENALKYLIVLLFS